MNVLIVVQYLCSNGADIFCTHLEAYIINLDIQAIDQDMLLNLFYMCSKTKIAI